MKLISKAVIALTLLTGVAFAQTTHYGIVACGPSTPRAPFPACNGQLVPSPDGTTFTLNINNPDTMSVSINNTGLVTYHPGTVSFTTPALISGDFFSGGRFDAGGSFALQMPDFNINYSALFSAVPLPGYTGTGGVWIVGTQRKWMGAAQGYVTFYRYGVRAYLDDGNGNLTGSFYALTKQVDHPFDGTTPLDIDTFSMGINQ